MQDLADKLPLSPAEAETLLTGTMPQFQIGETEIRGVPTKIWQQAPNSLREVFANTQNHGAALYLVYEDERLSYREHYRQVVALANQLATKHGIVKGERVVLVMRNRLEWVVAFWAITVLGAIVVPLNAWWTGPELSYGIKDSGAKLAILDDSRWQTLAPHFGNLDLEAVIVAPDGDRPQPADSLSFATLSTPVPGQILPHVEIAPEDAATIFYTSGTSGTPKGALGSHRNICNAILSVAYASTANELIDGRLPSALSGAPRKGVALISVPFFHVTGCHAILMSVTASGNALVVMRKWDVERALALIEREQVTSFAGVPGMAWQILESPVLANYDTSSLTSISYGGAPAAPGLRHRFREKLATTSPRNSYGMTETSSLVTTITGQAYLDHPDSVGRALPIMTLKIVGPDGRKLAIGEVGELWMHGAHVVTEYWQKPEASAESFTDGWVHSGDLAKLDAEGYLYIVDRAKDMLIRGGENIYCVEVEDALFSHPEIIDAAVFGKPHPVLGEEVVAVVQRSNGAALDATSLIDYLAERIAGFKIPVDIHFLNQPLPRNANGKIVKSELREEFSQRRPTE